MERNKGIDILRGFAALLVVVGHVLQRYEGHDQLFVFNFIQSIQMPLFMALAGYVRTFTKRIENGALLASHLKRRAQGILIPWFVWSALAYILVSKRSIIEHVKFVSFHMEGAFWFLFSIFCIDVLFSFGQFIALRMLKEKNDEFASTILSILFMGGGTLILLLIGFKTGLSFLGIKYTVYYTIYYLFGYCYSLIHDSSAWKKTEKLRDVLFVILLIAYITALNFVKVSEVPDFSVAVLLRIAVSLIACWLSFECIHKYEFRTERRAVSLLTYFGSISLEMYVVHYFVVRFLEVDGVGANLVFGFVISLVHSLIVVAITIAIISIINTSDFSRLLLFGKKKRINT